MLREISSGGVVARKARGTWHLAAIELPGGRGSTRAAGKSAKAKPVFALPKGSVDAGERPLEAALREVKEETGITASAVTKLADSKYVYVRSWGDGQRVFKIVSFYLLRYESGRINHIAKEMRIEVKRAFWMKMTDAPTLLSYKGERDIARRALEYIKAHAEF